MQENMKSLLFMQLFTYLSAKTDILFIILCYINVHRKIDKYENLCYNRVNYFYKNLFITQLRAYPFLHLTIIINDNQRLTNTIFLLFENKENDNDYRLIRIITKVLDK